MTFDLDVYLQRIGFDGEVAPDLPTLSRLVECHAQSIPFANIDTICGRIASLDIDVLMRKLVVDRRGGYCYEQNTLFMACLRSTGFDVQGLEARVRTGAADDVHTARSHMAMQVTIDGDAYLADVGFGGLAPLAPLRLGSDVQQCADGAAYRLVDVTDGLMLQLLNGADWSNCYRIERALPTQVDFDVGNWYASTNPQFFLRRNLLVGRALPGGRLTLFNRRLSRRNRWAPATEATLQTRSEIGNALRHEFGLTIDEADLDQVMATLAQSAS